MKLRPPHPSEGRFSLRDSLLRSFLKVNLTLLGVLFLLLSLPPLGQRLFAESSEAHLKRLMKEARPIVQVLRELPRKQQMQVLEWLEPNQLSLDQRSRGSRELSMDIYSIDVSFFAGQDQVSLLEDGKVVWSQLLTPGDAPAGWPGQMQQGNAISTVNLSAWRERIKNMPDWLLNCSAGHTWITPLGEGRHLAITTLHVRKEWLGISSVVMYLLVLLGWFILMALPATLGALLVSGFFARREARTLSRPIEDLSNAAQKMASGDLHLQVPLSGPAELRQLGHDLSSLGESLSCTLQDLQNTLGQQRAFLQDISHDLRTPLSHVLAFSEDLSDRLEGSPLEQKITIIHHEAQALQRMLDDLFDLMRMESPAFRLHLETLNVGEVVQHSVEAFHQQARGQGVGLHAKLPEGPVLLHLDRVRLQQVLGHLLSNSLQHTPEKGHITVTLSEQDRWVTLMVRDTGRGIPAEHLPHVFERFYRAEPAAGGRHAGLGLTLCQQLVQQMGGTVSLKSTPGAGTEVTVNFPAARMKEVFTGTRQQPSDPPPSG
ncbi:sensor histidine kinase [Deinococcus cellulosilyticus]|uniref:histidine kinase n=1 Tax=Deinococcus cellulosilyticus (strain DSM 18568 / NBRC 106333 / KACC 11606 / 5516J-15) TaxID=1223518 RepID=A0A511N8J3_DEIC1|nr:HAMP domain-containing sensor histidine kinase [Deinococcus cellulosilyticus]GEM49154.1 hypothetical protein DC3_47890 [Deinococcus cellulosilyticus NBRC 106333 = KACC 11606]